MNEDYFKDLEISLMKAYPFGIPRNQIGTATGGAIDRRTIANMDVQGIGISGRYKIGQKVFYKPASVIEFIKSRMSEEG